jgi:outer membrane immunogenic protein
MRCVLNRFFAGACLLLFVLAGFGAAFAADDFAGFYVGANIGGNLGEARVDTNPAFSPVGYFNSTSTPAIAAASNQKMSPDSFMAGGVAGYNHQWDNFVLGVETDFGKMSWNQTTTATATYPCCAPTAFTVTQSMSTSWLVTIRPRLGLVFGKMMVYGTGGLALTSVQYNGLFTDTFATAHESATSDKNRAGWVAGAGGEYRLTHHWSVKGEYLYGGVGASILSNNLTAFSPVIAFPSNNFDHTVNLKPQIARAGLNFRF